MNKILTKRTVFITTFAVLACNITSFFNQVSPEKLDFPKTTYSRIGWLNDQLVAVVDDPYLLVELKFAKQGDSSFTSILMENNQTCSYSTRYHVQDIFHNNTIQINKKCFTEPYAIEHILHYDWDTQSVKKVFGPLPLGTTVIYWNPNETQGLVLFADAFAKKTLYSITKDDFGPLDISIIDEGKIWNFSDFYPDFPDVEATTGNVGRADWSPNGNSIVFFASPDSVGKTGFERMSARYKIYVMDAVAQEPEPILDNIYFPFIIKWSPDSKYLAFIGRYKNSSSGIWLYTFEDFSVSMIDQGDFRDILWNQKFQVTDCHKMC